jgi:hypothetical protein
MNKKTENKQKKKPFRAILNLCPRKIALLGQVDC